MQERYVCLDIGAKRIGVAISDPFNSYALPSLTYERKNLQSDIQGIAKLLKEKGATCLVCGMPLNTDGTKSVQTQKTKNFIEALKGVIDIPIELEDERFTTCLANEQLSEGGLNGKKRRACVDAVAAANILDGFLARKNKEIKMKDEKDEIYKNTDMDETEVETEDETEDEPVEDLEEDDIVTLIDDEGKEIAFKFVGVTEYKGGKYVFLVIAEPNDDIAEDEVVIFKLNEEENTLDTIEDEELMETVFKQFQEEMDEGDDEDL